MPTSNPFRASEGNFHVSSFRRLQLIQALNGTAGQIRMGLLRAWDSPVAFWINGTTSIRGDPASSGALGMHSTAEVILRDAAAQSTRPTVVFVLHALPDKGCHIAGAASELCCHYRTTVTGERVCGRGVNAASHVCEGLAEYKSKVVDELASLLSEYADALPIALVLEPDSLSVLSIKEASPACMRPETQAAYAEGIAYAIGQVSTRAPRVALYLAAGSGEQLGWGNRANAFVAHVAHLGPLAFRLRGFATNIGGYQALGIPCLLGPKETLPNFCRANPHHPCCDDPCGRIARFSSGVGELNYVQFLEHHLRVALPGLSPRFVVDTGRNGITISRQDCDARCNLRAAGLGRTPTTETDLSTIDAYYWLLPPGTSDGCSTADGSLCSEPNPGCSLDDALGSRPGEASAPASGMLFIEHLRQLATQAARSMPLTELNLDAALEHANLFSKMAGMPLVIPVRSRHQESTLANLTVGGFALVVLMASLTAVAVKTRHCRKSALDVYNMDDEGEEDEGTTCAEAQAQAPFVQPRPPPGAHAFVEDDVDDVVYRVVD